ncbi:putative undecaprenyl-phosphate N-acetylglucosaminyl 1-phosphate transferase TagO [Gottschalkia purinilytica]|uniref:Putative undecaprenyl-phosphate N-acetylglucosaminyl 1-phosphate transferase TagO n=1 Tax=Gottschalkia purinilytica TaxID=1503 RepID=A0A0L0WE23_GOTPU|nr:MraY family glycosyltransferase [Gottschalkia purinilytica]KNF09724.1 putative undecaprenyl-phosphate N-acetylglucosaminyl 1-phosphate transferase TagO [Gottschalkia purinilytica]
MSKYYIAFFLPLILSFSFTPLAKKIAYKVGAIDVPKDERRVHKVPIPRLGGIAIYLATIISMIALLNLDRSVISILIGGSIIAITGIVDDIKPMSAKLKLVLQVVAAAVLILGDVKIEAITNPFDKQHGLLHLGSFAIPITIFWVVGITNTLNLIDGLDGLSAGVSAIAALSFLFITYGSVTGEASIIIMSAIIAGAAFGFLPFNFNPAKIFMGDTGALFLGYMLSVIAIEGAMKSVATIAIVTPILALGLPIFDTTFAILRRLIDKKPIMEADRGHLHHRLLDKGLSQRQTVLVLYIISVILGASAIVIAKVNPGSGILIISFLAVLAIISMTRFGIVNSRKNHRSK